jgi:hypothetical protein
MVGGYRGFYRCFGLYLVEGCLDYRVSNMRCIHDLTCKIILTLSLKVCGRSILSSPFQAPWLFGSSIFPLWRILDPVSPLPFSQNTTVSYHRSGATLTSGYISSWFLSCATLETLLGNCKLPFDRWNFLIVKANPS